MKKKKPATLPKCTADQYVEDTLVGAQDSKADQCVEDTLASTGMTYGYIRVSTRDQNEARQVIALKAFGVDRIYMDKQSGIDFDRPAYKELLASLKPGDVLVVKSIDRLGRNYEEILSQWRHITKEIKAAIVVLDMSLLDTRNTKDLTGTLIADIVLQLLSYVAETERTLIKERQREGIAAAKARGQRFGRRPFPIPAEFPEVREKWNRRELNMMDAAKALGVSHVTFLKWVKNSQSPVTGSGDGSVGGQ